MYWYKEDNSNCSKIIAFSIHFTLRSLTSGTPQQSRCSKMPTYATAIWWIPQIAPSLSPRKSYSFRYSTHTPVVTFSWVHQTFFDNNHRQMESHVKSPKKGRPVKLVRERGMRNCLLYGPEGSLPSFLFNYLFQNKYVEVVNLLGNIKDGL